MSFNPNDYVSPYVTLEEVLEVKKAFDLFDRDLGGAIDPRGINGIMKNSKLLLIPWVLKPRLKPSIKWLQSLTKMAVDRLSSPSSSTWWLLVQLTTKQEMRFTKCSLPLILKKQVSICQLRIHSLERFEKSCKRSRIINWWQRPSRNDWKSRYWSRRSSFRVGVLCPHYQESPLIRSILLH